MTAVLQYGWGNRACQIIVTLAVVATAAMALVVDRVDSYSLLALGLVGMYVGFRYGFGRGLTAAEKLLVWIAAAYAGIAIFAYLNGVQTNLGFRMLGRFLRFIVMIPAYLALRRLGPPRWAAWAAFVAGSVVAAGCGLAQYFETNGVVRAAGDSIAITFGDLALMSGFVAIVMMPDTRGGWRRWLVVAAGIVGLAGGLTASILSGTRGGWLAIPVFGGLTIAALTRDLGIRWRLAIIGGAIAVAAAVVAVPAIGMGPRIAEAVGGWNSYIHFRDAVAAVPKSTCISARPLARGLAHSAIRHGDHAPRIEAVQDAGALEKAGFGDRCAGGMALHLTADSDHGGWAWISRIVDHDDMPGFASVLVRGTGRVRISGTGEQRVHWPEYRKIVIAGKPQRFRRYDRLGLEVPAGDELWVVPLQMNPGAYRYFYTATSVGARLAMWGVAWDIFTNHWIAGVGTGAYRAAAAMRVDEGLAAPVTATYDHPHNQYLNALASRGIIGMIELLLLLGVPAYLFAGRLGARDAAVRRCAYAGMIVISGFAIFGMTETIFNHSLIIDYYVIFVGTFTALMYTAEEDATLASSTPDNGIHGSDLQTRTDRSRGTGVLARG
ncbi:MAG TPA: O-antigen ligase family protein [Gammaproteobacteria bacterium]|nr:O-antigen ligase family protein [Gammaproteobacteria bacterium]